MEKKRAEGVLPALPLDGIGIVEFPRLEQFLTHEKQRHARRSEREHGGQGAFTACFQSVRVVLADLGDEAALAVEPAGFVVILRVDDATETEIAVHAAGDFFNAARCIGAAQELRNNTLAVGSVEIIFPRGIEAAVAD